MNTRWGCLTARVIERWLPVPGYLGYEASDMGRIRRNGRVLHPAASGDYRRLNMRPRAGQPRKSRSAHSVIATTFLGPAPPGLVCCHANGNGRDNRLVNLRWDTPRANTADAFRHGTFHLGEKHYRAVLNDAAVRSIRTRRRCGVPLRVLADEFGLSVQTIHKVVQVRTWKHVEI